MSEKVSSFVRVDIGDFRYLFFLVTWNEFVTSIRDELKKQADPFGEVLGLKGKVVRSFESMARETFRQVTDKKWPQEIKERIEQDQDPFMLIIDKSFKEFDPQEHQWSIIWFSDFQQKTSSIYRLFGALAVKVQKNEDLFAYLNSVARKDKYKALTKYLELKTPQIFGISIDIKAILDDIIGEKN
jgi:hypothetical protein